MVETLRIDPQRRASLLAAALLLAWTAFGVPASKATEPMDPRAFTSYVAEQFKTGIPELQVKITSDLTLRGTSPPDNDWTISLDNDYRAYLQDPSTLPQVVSDRLELMRELLAEVQLEISLDRVFAVVRGLDRMQALEAQGFVRVPHLMLNEHLVVLYVLDSERAMRFLTAEDLSVLGLPSERLHATAIENLQGYLTNLEVAGEQGFYMITGGDSYESSLMLFDFIWAERRLEVKGDFVVFLPNHYVLLVTGSEDPENLARAQALAVDAFSNGVHPITDLPFVRRDGRWVLFRP